MVSIAKHPALEVKSLYGAQKTEISSVFVPPQTESYQPDADGNLTQDGRWNYTWDAENRLVQMIRDAASPSGANQRLVFEYDHQGRRIRKTFSIKIGNDWVGQSDLVFLYDGWNLVAELDANASNAKVRTYVWGTDLSGSMTGAGGVGGLLKLTYYGSTTTNAFVAYDGNGNVAALVDGGNGNVAARYDYGPFAEPICVTGTMAKANPVCFSSKYTDRESDLLYYGYRYYNPSTGRWLTRDPAGEKRDGYLYVFANNEPGVQMDPLGLWSKEAHIRFMDDAFEGIVKKKYLKIIKKANVAIDSRKEEGRDYKHAMAEMGERPDDALEKMWEFIAENRQS